MNTSETTIGLTTERLPVRTLKVALWNNLPGGGGKRALFELAAGLLRRGHHLESWCPTSADRDYCPLHGIMREHVVDCDLPPFRSGNPWHRVGFAYYSFRHRFAAMDAHLRKCAEAINNGGFDVLLATNCSIFAVPGIARYLRVPKVIYHQEPRRDLHEARPNLPWLAMPQEEYRFWPLSKLKRMIADFALITCLRAELREEVESVRGFDLVLVNSAYSRESMLRCYGLDSQVCYLGVNTELFRPNRGLAATPFVVGLGGVQRHKGVDTAIKAVAEIPPSERPQLVWLGNVSNAEYLREVSELAQRLGVNFVARGIISDDLLVECLSRASLMIYTSRLEPFGFAPLEANACGTPVVAISEGGIRETIRNEENGLLVPDRRSEPLGAAVRRLLENPSFARQLGEAGMKDVHRFWTWDSSVQRLEASLLALTASRSENLGVSPDGRS